MFRKILIANRGEIACRIIRTARSMGINTVAVYSAADEHSLHVRQADEAFYLGPAPAIDSYLNINALLNIAQNAKADAIHPGYGFLSENPDFAQACTDTGIQFIGPSVQALRIMGSKQIAKQHLAQTAIPLIPGYHGTAQSDEILLAEAQKIGFPLLIKAANGGGGKGMRDVHQQADFLHELAAARREAAAYFANDTVILEKLIQNPRHIEIQIMADNFGQTVHLFERDCSIQRRHQKVLEEAPAAQLSDELRQKMTEAAIKVAQAIDYRGAGTVECLVENNANFYFMEMNTRLQVEHPVSEMITGIDLVAWQIKIAANQPLPCSQAEISVQGHAIECRVYAEDPSQQFLPSTGQIRFLKMPQHPNVRIDSGIELNSNISIYYDAMLAKIIAWGSTRSEAIHCLISALKQYYIGGVKTNRSYLLGILQNPEFAANTFTTHFLQDAHITLPKVHLDLALAAATAVDYAALSLDLDPIYLDSFGWQILGKSCWQWDYRQQEDVVSVTISPLTAKQFRMSFSNQTNDFDEWRIDCDSETVGLNNGQEQRRFYYDNHKDRITIYFEDEAVELQRISLHHSHAVTTHQPALTAPMPGTVVAILKQVGDSVVAGEAIIVLEAMKMEHSIQAPHDGKVEEIGYPLGAQVQEGAILAVLEPL